MKIGSGRVADDTFSITVCNVECHEIHKIQSVAAVKKL